MNEIMNEDLKSSAPGARPQTKWADLMMHTVRMVVAYDPRQQSKRLCLLGSLSAAQRRLLMLEGFYEEQGILFRNELNFGLAQLSNIFPYVRVVSKYAEEIGVTVSDLLAMHLELKRIAAARPTILSTKPSVESDTAQANLPRPLLTIEPVPFSSRFSSVRTHLAQADFNRLKKSIYIRAGYRCEICGENGFEQGHQHPVECHEVFEFDETSGTQKMSGLMCVCPNCHSVKNIELTRAKSEEDFEAALNRLASINGWSKSQSMAYYQHSMHVWKERSKKSWILNLQLLDGIGLQFPSDNGAMLKRVKRGREANPVLPFLAQMPLSGMKMYAQAGVQSEI